ncbi:MAG: hypothetical protein G3M70_15545 [Candidatus Nitronauta litoralis]|uniref:Uncharacterized protein n=1 Tax=Candidatus Nitronauta litoralis TaxID=2705533 RepID=A0A7T0BYG6_9BACT|nr:MAG: hypothetical protein G3M70_15545 [Candidatus Nitronauta litoralis]
MLKKEETILKEILWGERPYHHLSFLKINHSLTSEGHRIENPRHLNIVAKIEDLARGILRYYKEPSKLQEWARFILEANELYDLDLGNNEWADQFLKELKNISTGNALEQKVLDHAREIMPFFPKKRALGEPEIPGNPT